MNLNKSFILGNLTRDPELRQTPNGQPVCSFGMATNRVYTDGTGQKQEQVEFHNIVAWGRLAELCSQYLQKGRMALVEGRLQTHSWQDQQGAKHYRTEIIADQVQFGPQRQGENPRPQSQQFGGAPQNQNQTNPGAQKPVEDPTPIIELPGDEEIDVKDIPF